MDAADVWLGVPLSEVGALSAIILGCQSQSARMLEVSLKALNLQGWSQPQAS
jgi:hypothetical protein